MATICFDSFSHKEMKCQDKGALMIFQFLQSHSEPADSLQGQTEEEEVPANQSQASVGQASNYSKCGRDSDAFIDYCED